MTTNSMDHDVEIFSAGSFPKEDLSPCIELLEQGDAVDPESARVELPRAYLAAILRDGRAIVGVGAIKRKRPRYAAEISAKCGFVLEAHWHELGYVVTAPTHGKRGISKAITAKLLASFLPRPLFATTSSSYMKNTLKGAGFQQKGSEWKGKSGQLSLWLHA
jgi:hypothetical protein